MDNIEIARVELLNNIESENYKDIKKQLEYILTINPKISNLFYSQMFFKACFEDRLEALKFLQSLDQFTIPGVRYDYIFANINSLEIQTHLVKTLQCLDSLKNVPNNIYLNYRSKFIKTLNERL